MRARRVAARWMFVAMIAATPQAAVIEATSIDVRVYDVSGDADLERALAEASASLASAAVDVTWWRCAREHDTPHCGAPLRPRELVLRVVRSKAPRAEGILFTLGDAFVEPNAGGVFATVYADRVQRLAGSAGTDADALLGRAIAHEIGHLLLASTVHGRFGLMRAVWSRDELRRNQGRDWRFTTHDALAIRARVLR